MCRHHTVYGHHLETVVRPRSDLQHADLVVKREVGDVYSARATEMHDRAPEYPAREVSSRIVENESSKPIGGGGGGNGGSQM